MDISFSLEELAGILDDTVVEGSFRGNIKGIASLEEADSCDLSFLGNPKYASKVQGCKAGVIYVPTHFDGAPAADQAYIRTANASLALGRLSQVLERKLWPAPPQGIHPTSYVHETAQVDDSAHIGPLCSVGEGTVICAGVVLVSGIHVGRFVKISPSSRLQPGVVVQDYCELGREVRLQSGCVIGSDGYGYETIEGHHVRIPQVGRVILEDFVEVGANSTVDRARFKETRIGQGTKIDNLVQIAHNVQIGRNCLVVAQVGIGGSTIFGDNVVIGGQAGIAGHLKIGKGVSVAGQSGVSRNLEAGAMVRGTPSLPYLTFQRVAALQKRLPEFYKRLKTLEQICDPDNSQ